MSFPRRYRFLVAACLASAGLLAGCASDDDTTAADSDPTSTSTPTTEGATPDASGSSPSTTGAPAPSAAPGADAGGAGSLPSIAMTDVATGGQVDLAAALSPSDGRPAIAWFWAPYCPTCRAEAPELDAFMAEHGEEVALVGVGTQNDLDQAGEFLDRTGVSNFPLLWEDSGASWAEFGVSAQPYMVLIDDGEIVQRWPGSASEQEILEALDQLA